MGGGHRGGTAVSPALGKESRGLGIHLAATQGVPPAERQAGPGKGLGSLRAQASVPGQVGEVDSIQKMQKRRPREVQRNSRGKIRSQSISCSDDQKGKRGLSQRRMLL